jgi:WD40 repeat protein
VLHTFAGHSDVVSSVAFSPDGRQLLSGNVDGTTRVWNGVTGAALAATSEGDWLAITPDGFFAGAAKTSDKMMSVVRGLDVTTISQVHQSLFNPDLVRAALAEDPDGEVRDAAKIINLEKVLDSGPAPTVIITSPVEGSQSKSDVVTVQARVTDRGKGMPFNSLAIFGT